MIALFACFALFAVELYVIEQVEKLHREAREGREGREEIIIKNRAKADASIAFRVVWEVLENDCPLRVLGVLRGEALEFRFPSCFGLALKLYVRGFAKMLPFLDS
jgi:hypothetical protein